MRFLQMNRDYLKGEYMESLIEKEENNWTSKKELAEICSCDVKTLERIITDLNCDSSFAIQNHIKKGGYHNLETYYDDYLVKLIQAKLKQNAINAGGQKTSGSIIKQSNMEDMEVGMAANAVMASGSIEAAEQFAQLLISRTKAVAETKRLQAANTQLLIENSKLKEAVCDAYNEGYAKGRCKINYMYGYDIY